MPHTSASHPRLSIVNIAASVDETQILKGVSLDIAPGQVHAIMGPNGSGKSTLAHVVMGHPSYEVTGGTITVDGEDITEMEADKRARKRIFLAFQYPLEVEGLPLRDFLRTAYNAWYAGTDKQIGLSAFNRLLAEKMELLGLDQTFVERSLNVGFSGGEKKQAEMLQMAVLEPRLAVLDEIDSGLDVDALKRVCNSLHKIRETTPDMSVLLITHYHRILQHVTPDHVHVMQDGVLTRSGGVELALSIEDKGYKQSL